MLFPEIVFRILIYAALGLTSVSTIWLLALLYRDWRDGTLW